MAERTATAESVKRDNGRRLQLRRASPLRALRDRDPQRLLDEVDPQRIEATLSDGVLEIRIPKPPVQHETAGAFLSDTCRCISGIAAKQAMGCRLASYGGRAQS
jgi:hypothetical protein